MDIDLARLLHESDVMLVFTALALGLLLGRLRLGGLSLGPTPGVLLVAILFGHWGFQIEFSTESLGFMLFIFCVGIEAGPNAVLAFRREGYLLAGKIDRYHLGVVTFQVCPQGPAYRPA